MNGIRKKVTPRDSRGLTTLEIKIDRKREREREKGEIIVKGCWKWSCQAGVGRGRPERRWLVEKIV